MSVDPITGLSNKEDSSQEPLSSGPFRPQSPLVRGSHLDKSVDRITKRCTIANQAQCDLVQLPAKRGELQGLIPSVFGIVHPREKLDHIIHSIQCVIDGKEEFVSEQELMLTHPLNFEKTRFSMSNKKLKLQFIDDVLDRFENERWLYPDRFERRRKVWRKSVTRSLKSINKFLENEYSSARYVRQHNDEESYASTGASRKKVCKGSRRMRPLDDSLHVLNKSGRKTKVSAIVLGIDSRETSSKRPIFGRKKKKVADSAVDEAPSPKKRRKNKAEATDPNQAPAVSKVKKPAFGDPRKGNKETGILENFEREDGGGSNSAADLEQPKTNSIREPVRAKDKSDEEKNFLANQRENLLSNKFDVYEQMDEEEKPLTMTSRKSDVKTRHDYVAPTRDDGMETDDDEWEPENAASEITPPRGLFSTSLCVPPCTSSLVSHSSQSLFGSSSLIASPNASFSSQGSLSQLTPSILSSFNLSSPIFPSEPIASSTQISANQPLAHDDHSEIISDKGLHTASALKKPATNGPRVRPMFGRKK